MVFCSSQMFADLLVELQKVTGAALKLAGSVDLSIARKDLKGMHDRIPGGAKVYTARYNVLGCTPVTCGGSSSWHRPIKLPIFPEG
jgi:hypothetical protein